VAEDRCAAAQDEALADFVVAFAPEILARRLRDEALSGFVVAFAPVDVAIVPKKNVSGG
jgi:hypothetical protein